MDPLMFLQVASYRALLQCYLFVRAKSDAALHALGGFEWLLSCMGPLKFHLVVLFQEALVTLRAFERLLSCLSPLMLLQGT